MDRRDFLKSVALGGIAIATGTPAEAAEKARKSVVKTAESGAGFTLWQIPSQVNTIGNSYVFLTNKGRVLVMDGGVNKETPYLRGFLGALGNEVEAWFISHPHGDHMGALNEILKDQNGLKINRIYHSRLSQRLIDMEKPYDAEANEFYKRLDETSVPVTDLREPGLELKFDGLNLKVLGVANEDLPMNTYNNSSIIFRVWDKRKSMVFLGDAGVECGNKVLNGSYAKYLDCDYMQMAHHGQRGCDENFYKTVKFRVCLWPTPTWVWNNDQGKGYNTGGLKTFETRRWMDEKGIKEHHVSTVEGLWHLA